MINAGCLRFDSSGKIRNTVSAPVDFNAAVPSVQGLASIGSTGPDRWANGMPFTSTGQLSVQTTGIIVAHAQGGLPINDVGAIAVNTADAVAYRQAGLPYTATGRLAFATAETPVPINGFSSGFDEGFN